ncbi:DNA-formamidopyrimidine glycosylase family protein [Cnuibacter sp. UC19_7]|uniref:DNA-formamidopyrimidine glycosylase family protein n=1 Tax=Cnuibacter sp. UC19_7 TaxID=3350166 RepID=UPI00366C31EC
MPESPEVDALAGFLRDHAVGARIDGVELIEFRALKTQARPLEELLGETVTGVRRFGKHLSLDTTGADLVISFGRAGWATWAPAQAAEAADGPPALARLRFDSGRELAVTDAGAWLSLGLSVVDDPADVSSIANLGPDPSGPDFSQADLDSVLIGRRKQLRALLQEQESLAGIGGAYSDEILFAARLDPLMHAADLTDDERVRLFAATHQVLADAFAACVGVPIDRQKAEKAARMRVHGRTGEPCPGGDGVVADIPGTKGSGQYCPACQSR